MRDRGASLIGSQLQLPATYRRLPTLLWVVIACSGEPQGQVSNAPALPRYERTLLLEDSADESANVSAGDLNGDGHVDLVLAKGRHSPRVDKVLINDGHGRFVTHDLGPKADRSYSVPLVDLDRDGDLDIVVSNDAPDPKLIYLNDGKGNFALGSSY
jgi:hypothetical protein